jgi:hypothetical protein
MTYERRRLTISLRGVGYSFATLATTISRISNGKVVMFTPLVPWWSDRPDPRSERPSQIPNRREFFCLRKFQSPIDSYL